MVQLPCAGHCDGHANTECELTNATPDYQWWLNKELWELHKACSLLVGLEPVSSEGLHHPGQITQQIEDADRRETWGEIYGHAKDAMQLENIRSYQGRTGPWVGLKRVEPEQFVTWAKERKFAIPEPIAKHFFPARTTEDKERGPVRTRGEIAALFHKLRGQPENENWWKEASRAAKRNGLDRCKVGNGIPRKAPLFYLADVARWLIEKDKMAEDKVRRVVEATAPELLESGPLADYLETRQTFR